MTGEDPERLERLFQDALDLPREDRPGFIQRESGGDENLRAAVLELLRNFDQSGGWNTSAIEQLASEPVETALDRYRLLERIGAGGMAVVHKAVRADDEFSKTVAIKTLLAPDPEMVHRFRNERQMLAGLEHPYIARLLDGGTSSDGSPFLVMEFVDGVPITRYAAEKQLTVAEILELFRKICDAVAYAHRRLIVHRDLKPANILVTTDGVPKLLDFGIAKLLDSSELTRTVAAMTPEYASPEQLRGEAVTTSTDVYSLGVLLYELLAGARPFPESANTVEAAEAILHKQPPPLAARSGRRFDADIENIVQMALRKEPDRRYPSVESFAEDIRRYQEGFPVIAREDSRGYRIGKFIRRHRFAIAGAAVVIIAIAGGVAATLWEAREANRRFEQVRKLANSYLLEIHEAIRNLPGSTPARELVVRRALEYLEQLAAERGNDQRLARELATGYANIATIQGSTTGSSLGDTAGALASWKKAVAVLEPVAARYPRDVEISRDLASDYGYLGALLTHTGDLSAAVEYERKGVTLLEKLAAAHPKDPKLRQSLVTAYLQLGDVTGNQNAQNLGDAKGALAVYKKALAWAEPLSRDDPADWQKGSLLAVVHGRIGQVSMALGDQAGEAAELREGLAIEEKLLTAQPANTYLQWDVAIENHNLSLALLRLKQLPEARTEAQRAMQSLERMAREDPANIDARKMVADTFALLGRVDAESGQASQAMENYNRAIAAFRALRRPGAPPELGERNAHSLRADLALSRNDPATAIQSAQTELEIDDVLLKVNSNNASAERNRAVASRQLARAHELIARRRGQSIETRKKELLQARSLYERSLQILQSMQARGTLAASYARDLNDLPNWIAGCDRQLAALPR